MLEFPLGIPGRAAQASAWASAFPFLLCAFSRHGINSSNHCWIVCLLALLKEAVFSISLTVCCFPSPYYRDRRSAGLRIGVLEDMWHKEAWVWSERTNLALRASFSVVLSSTWQFTNIRDITATVPCFAIPHFKEGYFWCLDSILRRR